ncbi:MAG: GGDEF domain-containing protein [Nocardiopsaceae bacterium]|nr:GGDEF domain-containing protein [Nocardiopsaceae bacterium]
MTRPLRAWEIWKLAGWLRAYVIAVVIADLIAIGVTAYLWLPDVRLTQLLLFAALLGCGAITVELTRSRGETAGLIKDTYAIWELPAALLLPPVFGLLAPIPRLALTQWRIRQIAPHRRVFSAGVLSLSYGAASVTFGFLGSHFAQVAGIPDGTGGPVNFRWLLGVVVAGGIAWAVNNFLIVPAIKGSDPTVRVRDVIATREGILNDLAELCAAALVTVAIFWSPFSLVLALPLVIVLQRSSLHSQLVSDLRLDAKTGLLNAGTWRKEASAEVSRANRTRARVAVALIDVDCLKTFNDAYGHLAGDNALAMVADLLRSGLREDDIVGRFGGDEFAVLFPATDADHAQAAMEQLRVQIASTLITPGAGSGDPILHSTVSVGLAALPGEAASLTDVLALADSALYQAKNSGRDRVAVMTESGQKISTGRPG